ncbi:hypothetical protein [Calothrix sp. NIES-2098]|uniref:hypothetical protein n=1 Tax=Calothrix sp. NIES-2098 TaxID=1954171 RepID=UPI000B5EC4F0|nr:hypothetical protein NIES2098_25620 [Calothrix sp. NIES-2098]
MALLLLSHSTDEGVHFVNISATNIKASTVQQKRMKVAVEYKRYLGVKVIFNDRSKIIPRTTSKHLLGRIAG